MDHIQCAGAEAAASGLPLVTNAAINSNGAFIVMELLQMQSGPSYNCIFIDPFSTA